MTIQVDPQMAVKMMNGIATDGQPLLVGVVVLLNDYTVAPCDAAIDRRVDLYRPVDLIGGERRIVETPVPVDSYRRIAEGLAVGRRRKKPVRPRLAAVARRGEP